ncbi:unnamed protein product [Urochloa decumbens]|uniref:Receptor-like serine/threonine-protein kinase n=1 Tax=Urochloa decumbens TaxID=240449 RepID=A0ABC9AD43_9POAL
MGSTTSGRHRRRHYTNRRCPCATSIGISATHSRMSKLRVSSNDGNLELVGLSQSSASPGVVWSSNLSSSTVSPTPGSNVAVLRDNGNLVLVDGGNSSNVLWQSFDHPTDTLVPDAWIGENKITGEYQTLRSWRNSEDPAPGMFTDTVDPNGSSEFFYLWNGSRAYWRSGVWTGRAFANIPQAVLNVIFNQTYVETPAYRRVTHVLYDNATVTRMVLDLTGQTKQYLWLAGSQRWEITWSAPTVPCDAYALCGAFGICNQRSQPPCQCPPGFAPAAERDWGLNDWSGGCHRRVPLRAQSRAECELACLENCCCQAYAFSGSVGCAVWHDGFHNLEQLYAGDDGDDPSPSSLYLRLSESELQHLRGRGAKGKKNRLWLVLGIVLACLSVFAALGASALVARMLLSIRRRRLEEKMAKQNGSSLQVYSYGELRAATKNFSERLGGGGFGTVYRGVVNGHTQVAVKKLECLRQGDKQFRTEVYTLGLIQHVNLVRLLGFCSSGSGDEKMLVYEYMPNGSLYSYLFGGSSSSSPCPSWHDRYGIMLGIARGLAYLHEGCRECIIHCDIKPENILLDKDLCPKIADFGMAKLLGRDFSRVLTTIRGTIGYLAPEWISGLPISAKADAYSFGMVVFELISGRRNTEGGHDVDYCTEAEDAAQRPSTFFPVWASARVAEGDTAAVADPRLHGNVSEGELERACRVACWCIQDQVAHRPTMAQVLQALEGVVDVYAPQVPQTLQYLTSLA